MEELLGKFTELIRQYESEHHAIIDCRIKNACFLTPQEYEWNGESFVVRKSPPPIPQKGKKS